MKKTKLTLAIVLLVCVISAFALTACDFEMDSTWDVSADTLDDVKEIFDEFVANGYTTDNMVITATNDDGAFFVEKIDGDKASVEFGWGAKAYAFVKEGNYVAAQNEEGKLPYYINDKGEYDYIYKTFSSYLFSVDEYMEEEGVRLNLTAKGKENKDGEEATLSLTITDANATTVITVEQKDDKITKFKNVRTDEDGSTTLEMAIEYNAAQVEVPDLTDWFNASAERVASEWYATGTIGGEQAGEIALYYDYTTGYYNSDYVDVLLGDTIVVKNKNDQRQSYTQRIDEEFLAGREMISFDANDHTIAFQSGGEPEEEGADGVLDEE